MPTMNATITRIDPPVGKGPYTLHHAGGVIKCWDESAVQFEINRSYEFPYYEKDYPKGSGNMECYVSGKGIIKAIPDGSASQAPVAAPQAPIPTNGGGTPQTTPMGVVGASQGTRELSIVAQAIIKSVIAVGGTEADVQRWKDCHDAIVRGERVG